MKMTRTSPVQSRFANFFVCLPYLAHLVKSISNRRSLEKICCCCFPQSHILTRTCSPGMFWFMLWECSNFVGGINHLQCAPYYLSWMAKVEGKEICESPCSYVQISNFSRYELRRWCVRARTRAIRGRTCVCVQNPFWKVCGMCVCAALFWACYVRSHFAHFLGQNCRKMVHFRTSFPALEHPILF